MAAWAVMASPRPRSSLVSGRSSPTRSGGTGSVVPVGGGNALDAQGASEVIAQIGPRVVIPMHYRTAGGDAGLTDLAPFIQTLGVEPPAPQEKYTVRKSDLSESVKVVILEP